jgi:ABC-2 type transport system permease protein
VTVAPTAAPGGQVYDRGYRPYEGQRGGRIAVVRALWIASMRRALGLRRSWRQKLLPWGLLVVVSIPAIVAVGIAYVTRNTPGREFRFISYQEYVGVSTALLLFVAITAPDIMCPDRRQRVLPLILSRPLTGLDYVFAKVSAIFTIVFAFGFLPQVLLFVGRMLVSDSALDYFKGHLDILWKVPLSVAVLALYYALLGTAAAAITTRRVVAAVTFLGTLLVSSVVTHAVVETQPGRHSLIGLLNLLVLPLHLRDVIFEGHVSRASALAGEPGAALLALVVYAAVVAACAGVLAYRYRWIER